MSAARLALAACRTAGHGIDAACRLAGLVAMTAAVGLTMVMLWEVAARTLAGAPTLWSADVGRYLNGAMFAGGAAYGLLHGTHVRIDFATRRLPARLRHGLNGAAMTVLVAPIAAWLSVAGLQRTARAVERAQVELVSAWQPLVWPILAVLTAGLALLALKALKDGLGDLAKAFAGDA